MPQEHMPWRRFSTLARLRGETLVAFVPRIVEERTYRTHRHAASRERHEHL
jgi:hypothetical protein